MHVEAFPREGIRECGARLAVTMSNEQVKPCCREASEVLAALTKHTPRAREYGKLRAVMEVLGKHHLPPEVLHFEMDASKDKEGGGGKTKAKKTSKPAYYFPTATCPCCTETLKSDYSGFNHLQGHLVQLCVGCGEFGTWTKPRQHEKRCVEVHEKLVDNARKICPKCRTHLPDPPPVWGKYFGKGRMFPQWRLLHHLKTQCDKYPGKQVTEK
ncbi:hypothetical protein NA57DRAFT_60077 [Rhizodiscina lignyota]|uniref:Uncharacterized protein n=1 Tax=Rhizodiscina lignyota TaxID=1504668 RepID=A0A9P4I931_9PEZI|nr:hypothetical protein NA57DRAFT_60077 [Rhizodiscina lignyota]